MKLSKNFDSSEFSCRCNCGREAVHPLLIDCLQALRDHVQSPITITSGVRCPDWNEKCGGASGSYHLPQEDGMGYAADIQVFGWDAKDVYELLDKWYPRTKGIGKYSSWVHFDVREHAKARWVG